MKRNHKTKLVSLAAALTVLPAFGQNAIAQDAPVSPDVTSGSLSETVLNSTTNEVLVIDAASLSNSQSLGVTAGTVAIINFSNTNSITLPGDLNNFGTIYAVTSNPNVLTAHIAANNIFNQQNALISTVLPTGGISGLSNLYTALSLNLTAVHDIVNYGTISSAGSLSATAGGIITNGAATTAGANIAIMQAVNNLNLQASQIVNSGTLVSQLASINATTASLMNSGTIQAAMGSANFQSLTNSLLINNAIGSILAQDSISFKTLDKVLNDNGTPGARMDVLGGTLSATSVDFNSDCGWIEVDADRINGSVSIKGAGAAVASNGGVLQIASVDLSGDPIFSINGDLDLTGVNFNGAADYIALATGNIIGGAISINTNGSQIFLSAGYNFTINNSNCTNCSGQFTTTTISNPNASISLGGSTFETSGTGNAGAVTIQATGGVQIGSITARGADATGTNGGTIIITAGGDVIGGSIDANGGRGQDGTNGTNAPNNPGTSGTNATTFTGDAILATGGNGGNGGPGAPGGRGGDGFGPTALIAIGGNGGNGGDGNALGAAGGQGGVGGSPFTTGAVGVGESRGGRGGNGGRGAAGNSGSGGFSGGNAGSLQITSTGNVAVGVVSARGGAGGRGGGGAPGGNGGAGGQGGSAFGGGNLVFGNGGNGGNGGDGGNGGSGANGGTAGNVSVTAVSFSATSVNVSGGSGGIRGGGAPGGAAGAAGSATGGGLNGLAGLAGRNGTDGVAGSNGQDGLVSIAVYTPPNLIAVTGNLDLSGTNFNGATDFIALSTGSIFGTPVSINTNGSRVYLSAGYNFTVQNASTGTFTVDTSAPANPNAFIKLNGATLNTTGTAAAGAVTLQAPNFIAVGNITADGANGSNGGAITINTGGPVLTGNISANGGTGVNGADGITPVGPRGPMGLNGVGFQLIGGETIGFPGGPGGIGALGGAGGFGAPVDSGIIQIGGLGGAGGAPNTPAGEGGPGGNGGSATGSLGTITARGGAGGAGSNGANGAPGSNASSGGNGGTLVISSSNIVQTGSISLVGGAGGNGGAGSMGGAGGSGGAGGAASGATLSTGGIGGSGGNGGNGGAGGNAGAGGNGGTASVTASSFIFQSINRSGGVSGSLGAGGSGGSRGPGGAGGVGTNANGQAGTPGLTGNDGTAGLPSIGGSTGTLTFAAVPARSVQIASAPTQIKSETPRAVLLLNLPSVVSDATIIPTDKTPVRHYIENEIVDQESMALQGSISTTGDQMLGNAVFFGGNFNSAGVNSLVQNGIVLGPGQNNVNFLNLDKGSVLFCPTSDLTVQTHEGTVFIPAGAIALVHETGNDVAIYDFVDSPTKKIKVQSGDQIFALQPGQQVVLSRSAKGGFQDIHPVGSVGYRDIRKHDVGDGITAYLSDFSIISAMNNLDAWRTLRRSNTMDAKGTMERTMKTAAALYIVTGKKGPYRANK